MFDLPAVMSTYVLVHIICACVALGVGFVAGVWFFGARKPRPVEPPPQKAPSKKTLEEVKRAAERIALATTRVADLTTGVASDVGDHAAKMKSISADLAGIDRESAGANAAVLAAMDRILDANAELQQRLEVAETQLAAQAAEIKFHESEARTDSLTGLANRRAFDEELKRRLLEWERTQVAVSLILLDIDLFKEFNDTHGHQVGDEVLRHVAKTLQAHSRAIDLPCRYGGEEFAVILPATNAQGARLVAERVRRAIAASAARVEGKHLRVTCSVGLSQAAPGDDSARIIRRADNALYYSKQGGRNCGHWTDGTDFYPTCVPSMRAGDARPSGTGASGGRVAVPRRSVLHELKRRVAESHRFGIPLSVMFLRMEGYSAAVESCGSAVARQMVEVVGPAFEQCLREKDAVEWLGKGEFLVILPGNTAPESAQILKRMRMATAGLVLSLEGDELPVRFRDGVAELGRYETARELVARARQDAEISRPARWAGNLSG